jgi:hypothetical protein
MRKFLPLFLSGVVIALCGAAVVHADPMSSPSMTTPLAANPDPIQFDAGLLGTMHITGAACWREFTWASINRASFRYGILMRAGHRRPAPRIPDRESQMRRKVEDNGADSQIFARCR